MKKSILMLLLVLLFTACTSPPVEVDRKNVEEVRIADFKQFGTVNKVVDLSFEGEEVSIILEAINTSVKIDGIVDMADGDYDLLIIYSDHTSDGYHVWIDEKSEKGTLMDVKDTHTIYSMTESSTRELKRLLLND